MICGLRYSSEPTTTEILSDIQTIILGNLTVSNSKPTNLNASSTLSDVYGTAYTNGNSYYSHLGSNVYTKTHHIYTSDTNNWFSLSYSSNDLTIAYGDDSTDQANNNSSLAAQSGYMASSDQITLWVMVSDKLFGIGFGADVRVVFDIQKNSTNAYYADTSTSAGLEITGVTKQGYVPTSWDFENNEATTNVLIRAHGLNAPFRALGTDGEIKAGLSPVSIGDPEYGYWPVPAFKCVNLATLGGGVILDQNGTPYFTTNRYVHDGTDNTKGSITQNDSTRMARLIIQG